VHSGLHRYAGTGHAFCKDLARSFHTVLHSDPYSSTSSLINTSNSMVSVCMLLICCHLVTPACLSHTVTWTNYTNSFCAQSIITVHIECHRPFGFLSEVVRAHNPIASWAPLVASSGASHIPAVRSGLPLSSWSWNSAVVPCWKPSPDI